jgi:hypothetical protein
MRTLIRQMGIIDFLCRELEARVRVIHKKNPTPRTEPPTIVGKQPHVASRNGGRAGCDGRQRRGRRRRGLGSGEVKDPNPILEPTYRQPKLKASAAWHIFYNDCEKAGTL